MRLKNKVAIITGGSRGIGFATADKFLKEGATVILTASSQGSADKAVAQLKEKYPDATVAGISPNLASLESVREAFREATGKYGCVDILVNNAGVSESTPFMSYTEETYDKVMDLNVKGVFNATHAAAECIHAGIRRLFHRPCPAFGRTDRLSPKICGIVSGEKRRSPSGRRREKDHRVGQVGRFDVFRRG